MMYLKCPYIYVSDDQNKKWNIKIIALQDFKIMNHVFMCGPIKEQTEEEIKSYFFKNKRKIKKQTINKPILE